MRLNHFVEWKSNGRLLYRFACLMPHSCEPNCHFEILEGTNTRTIRVVLPVKKGDELTNAYIEDKSASATHIRRTTYLVSHEFTCHCARCMAPGDDTRRFNCFDAKCPGQHLACQPTNKEPLIFPDRAYTADVQFGPEYAEPSLLPCTECCRSPPLAYQQKMFALEARLPELAKGFMRERDTLNDLLMHVTRRRSRDVDAEIAGLVKQNRALFAKIKATPFPPLHSLSKDILECQIDVSSMIGCWGPETDEHVQATKKVHLPLVRLFARNVEARMQYPHDAKWLAYIWIHNKFIEFPPTLPELQQAKHYCGKAMRMNMVIHGRVRRNPFNDQKMADLCVRLRDAGVRDECRVDCCAFCGETPENAAIKLSLCGRCKQVAYCSKGCQTGHWKAHKTECGKSGTQ
jgi:hypothetical protein